MKKRLFSRLIFLYQHKKNNPQIDMKGRKNGERSQRSGRAVQVKVREGKGEERCGTNVPSAHIQARGKETHTTHQALVTGKKKERVLWSIHKEEGGNQRDRKSTRLNSSHSGESRMPSSA